jgi:glycosyltransferase involved in cell wall biosynthesis
VRARAIQPGPLRILFVGSLIARKGLHVLLEALTALPSGAWSLEVIGDTTRDPEYTARIRHQIAHPALQRSVSLQGAMADQQLAEALRRSQVLAVPSAHEGFGIAYLEAMGFGLPVLASASGGASEIVTEGETGFLIRPGDSHALAERLHNLSRDRARLAQLSLAAQQLALARPRWADSMESIRQFLVRLSPTGAAAPALSIAVGGVR